MEDYAELRRKVIEVYDDNYPAHDNIPQTNNTTATAARTSETALNWVGAEGIVCPRLARKLPATPAFLRITLTNKSRRCQSLIFFNSVSS